MNAPLQFTFRQSRIASLMAAAILTTATCPAAETPPAGAGENVAPAAGAAARTLDLEAAQRKEVTQNMNGFSIKEFKNAGGKFILKPFKDKTTVFQKTAE